MLVEMLFILMLVIRGYLKCIFSLDKIEYNLFVMRFV